MHDTHDEHPLTRARPRTPLRRLRVGAGVRIGVGVGVAAVRGAVGRGGSTRGALRRRALWLACLSLVCVVAVCEVVARVEAQSGLPPWNGETPAESAALQFGNARVDFDTHDVVVDGESLKLTQLELDLLRYFSENPLRVLSREELMEKVWKLRNYAYTRTVDNFIARLRKHFEEDATDPKHFLSVRGAGYKFVPDA